MEQKLKMRLFGGFLWKNITISKGSADSEIGGHSQGANVRTEHKKLFDSSDLNGR